MVKEVKNSLSKFTILSTPCKFTQKGCFPKETQPFTRVTSLDF
ncbi:hypothetical protein HMPREF9384_0041 [Streptococcus sanguinis SK160]|uniref:Uncharacterized protein n=1 Tax=Streptococcus sanguinis SK160 TaxID=888812 RepID=F0IQC9_STRSA|nr:hypothetical protein HMPREF9384_0041 [Streptococcus sanguinis SK160]